MKRIIYIFIPLVIILVGVLFYYKQNFSNTPSIKLITNTPLDKNGPSENCNAEICSSLLQLINEARTSIDFAIYGLRGQNEILQALVNAEKRGVKVRGLVDKNIENENYYSDTHLIEKQLSNIKNDYFSDLKTAEYLKNNNKKNNKCERPKNTKGPLQCFEGKGYASKEEIYFQGDIMHNKFFIIDKKYVWTGSANISDTGIGGYNANLVALVDSKFIAKFYTIEFNQMFIDGDFHRRKKKLKKEDIFTNIDGAEVGLYFSPQGYAMYRGVLPLIEEAEKTIDVSIFFLTHNNISRELVKAHKRGVKIRVILDATAATNGYSKHNYLREHGIPVKVESWGGKMHMKAAVFDNKHVIVGSMNWTLAGERNNDENTIIIKNSPKHANQLSSFFNSMWESIPDKWLTKDPLPESIDSGSSCYDLIDNDFDKKIDKKDEGCFN